MTTYAALLESLCVREFPLEEPALRQRIETPWHALMMEAKMRELHDGEICICLKQVHDKQRDGDLEKTFKHYIEVLPGAPAEQLERAVSAVCEWIDGLSPAAPL